MAHKIRSLLLFIVIWTCYSPLFAQQDSAYTDTVVIEKPPLIIKQKVHISVPVFIPRETSFDAGLYYSANKSLAPASKSITGLIQSAGFQLRYHEEKVEIGAGVGILTAQVTYDIEKQRVEQEVITKTTWTVDSNTCSTVIDPWGVKTTCDTTFSTVSAQETRHIPFTVEQKATLYYLQIPLSLGYLFKKNLWTFSPTLLLSYLHRLGARNEVLMQREELWMGGIQCSLGRTVLDMFQLEVKAQYQSNLSSVYHAAEYQDDNWKLIGFGVGVYYTF